ncbi:hypothetical protein [Paenibacillus planticolens]|uniref:Lipoprotein n=1 Tax=Paenibacillus planticolens TaxID=2654976 RepID=A0ABX1ZG39_9BACL|nr:hypothetical protein [Paenibacillus planticolens]NOU99056.1 hypothetical protein [Paenibacillus planticolens]
MKIHFVIFFVIAVLLTACKPNEQPSALTSKKLYELYPGDLAKVDTIEIRSGSTGELKTFTEPDQIQPWIQNVREISFVPDPNQEGRVGFLFSVSFFENKQVKFSFTTNSSGSNYYLHNEELKNSIQTLFDSK